MGKINLNEEISRIKQVMGLIKEDDAQQASDNRWNLLGFDIVERNGRVYAVDGTNKVVEIPYRDQIQGTIVGHGRNANIEFDELTSNGVEIGEQMRQSMAWNSNDAPLQTAGKQGWIAYVVRDGKQVSGMDLVNAPTFPGMACFAVSGTLGTEGGPVDANMAQMVKQKEGTVIKYRQIRTKDFIIELSPYMGGYSTYQRKPETKPQPQQQTKIDPIVQTFQKGLNDAFNFNDVTLNPTGNQNLQSLIEYAKQNYKGVSANVPVICSSSIDGDPNQVIKGGMTRAQYDMDLSKRRAEAIANMLTTQIGIDTLKFVPTGIGETDQYDPGKKWPTVTDKNLTAGNRKLIVQLPKVQVTINK
jgi:outer membrane protein OmpA-like peptidoglycan-associated protein